MSNKTYDLIIVGSGPGGYRAAEYAGHHGLKTLIIEKDTGRLGGTCLNYGCIPTKALLKCAKVAHYIYHSEDFGIETNSSKVVLNWTKMQKRKEQVVNKLVNGVATLMKMGKIDVLYGNASFVSKNKIKVGNDEYEAKNIILATGSIPAKLPLPGFEEAEKRKKILDSTGALEIQKLPKTMTIIGSGVIGVEFAMLFAELGVKVTIVQGLDRILEKLDNEISNEVAKILRDKKVEILTSSKVIEYNNKKDVLIIEHDGKQKEIKSDYTLVSVGRKPVSGGIDKIGVKISERGFILTNENLETNIPGIYAIGDCTSPIMLAHVAYKHSYMVIKKILNQKVPKFSYNAIPNCIYTFPEIAMIGKTEEELKAEKIDYIKTKMPMKILGKAIADGDENVGFIKLLVDRKYGEVLGCHIISSTASDMISELSVVFESEATVYEIADAVHPHPTVSEIIGDAAIDVVNKLNKLKKS